MRWEGAVNLGAFLPGIVLVPLPCSISVSLQAPQMSLFLPEVPAEAMVILEVVACFKCGMFQMWHVSNTPAYVQGSSPVTPIKENIK